MNELNSTVQKVNTSTIDELTFKNHYVGCLILTQDGKILLQQRDADWERYPGYLAEFGGRIETGETPAQALIRELQEELGATIKFSEVISLGAITEITSRYRDLIHVYFWHDKSGIIRNCYEGNAKYYENADAVRKHSKIMGSVYWLLNECTARGLL